MKHLIAYVERASSGWEGTVESEERDGTVRAATVEGVTCLEARNKCGRIANDYGVALDWSGGFVARGVEQDESVRGTREKGAGNDA